MKYVVVTKTHGEIPGSVLPANYPAECQEFESLDEAMSAHPNKTAFTVAEYKHYSDGLSVCHDSLVDAHRRLKRKWWKPWSKK
jgi:hypothetical protein